MILLHNPEHTLAKLGPAPARRALEDACGALAQAARENACGGWGISAWDAAALAPVAAGLPGHVRPDVVMTRAGLTVSARQLHAARDLVRALHPRTAWGMSPFGGAPRDPIWDAIDASAFVAEGPRHDRYQAAFRAACELPPVDLLIAGTGDRSHLARLAEAARLPVDHVTVDRYVALLDAQASVPAPRDGPSAGQNGDRRHGPARG